MVFSFAYRSSFTTTENIDIDLGQIECSREMLYTGKWLVWINDDEKQVSKIELEMGVKGFALKITTLGL